MMSNTRGEGMSFTDGIPTPPHKGLFADETIIEKAPEQRFAELVGSGLSVEDAELIVFGSTELPTEGEVVDEK